MGFHVKPGKANILKLKFVNISVAEVLSNLVYKMQTKMQTSVCLHYLIFLVKMLKSTLKDYIITWSSTPLTYHGISWLLSS